VASVAKLAAYVALAGLFGYFMYNLGVTMATWRILGVIAEFFY